MTEGQDFPAMARALLAWFKSQDIDPPAAITIMVALVGAELGRKAKSEEHLAAAIKGIVEIMETSAKKTMHVK